MALSGMGTSRTIRFALSANRDERDVPSPGRASGRERSGGSRIIEHCHPQRSAVNAIPMSRLAGTRARALCWHHMAYTPCLWSEQSYRSRVSRALILPCPYHMHELTAGIKTR